jgi:hypothetical protein
MKIVRSQKYTKSLQEALRFISLDSRQRALNFKHELDEKINSLDYMPYKFRQSIYFEDILFFKILQKLFLPDPTRIQIKYIPVQRLHHPQIVRQKAKF